MSWLFKEKKECRCCKGKNLVSTIDLGEMPLANSHKKSADEFQEKIPLKVMFCTDCANSQLSVVVNPEVMFSNYNYFSSISNTFKQHCFEMSEDLKNLINKENPLCVDIASNDGCLLEQFKQNGFEVRGIEPAKNIAEVANKNEIKTFSLFWNKNASDEILNDIGKVDVITATNVFAHVDDLDDFVINVKNTLLDDGVFVVEFPYMSNLVKSIEFDTIYHEHLSYFLIKPLSILFSRHGMKIFNLKEFDIHGGTIRLYISKIGSKFKINPLVSDFILKEKKNGLHKHITYKDLNLKINLIKKDFLSLMNKLSSDMVVAYGASAKGNVFLNFCNISSKQITYIVDDTDAKQGFFYSGTDIPIFSSEKLKEKIPDYIVILAWNFSNEIMTKTKRIVEEKTKFITAIPEIKFF